MKKTKKINKGISAAVASVLIVGGTSQVAIAATNKAETAPMTRKMSTKADEEIKDKWINVKTLPKIETTGFGKFYENYNKYRISFPGTTNEEFDKFKKYINAVNTTNEVTVNKIKYSNDGLVEKKDIYNFGLAGLDFNLSAFTEDINTIIVKAKGYNDMKIKIKKDGTFISQEEIKSENIDNVKSEKENKGLLPKVEKVEYSKFYSDYMKYRISFDSKTNEQWNCVNEYRRAVNKVAVNGVDYNSGNETEENNYNFGLVGLEINPSAFKEGINTVVIKANGYEDMLIKVKKDGDKVNLEKAMSQQGDALQSDKDTNAESIDEKNEQWREVTTLPKITKVQYGEIYGRIEYEIAFEKNDALNNYVKAADPKNPKTKLAEVTVNGIRYEDNFNFSNDEYHLSYMGGLELNENSFKEGINTIIVKVDGYNDMRIKVKKDGTLISQEEGFSGTVGKENIKISIMKDITAISGQPINLMSDVIAYAKGKEKIDLTDEVKVDAGNLDIKNPKEGIYEVTYSVTHNGQTETAKRKVTVVGGSVDTDKLTDGVYTIGFKAYRYDIPENESMLGGFFDEKVKVEVKNGEATLTMLNTLYAFSLLDFRIESNGKYERAKGTFTGEPNSQGEYQMQTYEVPISDLTSEHIGCVLVGMMGGSKNDIGDFSKYKKVRFIFDKTCIKGWNGFDKDKEVIDEEAEFNKALIEAGLDKNGDGTVTNEEIAKATGKVDLSGKKIKDISRLSHLGSGVTELYLSGNDIKYLPKGVFDGLTSVEKLYLRSNRIVELPEGIFNKLTNLKELALGQNYVRKVPKGIFDKLKNLKSLSFEENELMELSEHVFDNLTNLQGLYLYKNELKSIPSGIGKLKGLRTLNASDNKIEIVPKELSNLSNLIDLSLNNNLINEIPENVYKGLKNLSTFNVYDNELRAVPDNIDKLLPNVKYFDFKLNRLNKKPNISNLYKNGFYPQKNILNLQLSAKDGKLTWKQDLSALDIYVWEAYMKDCSSVDEYNKRLNGKTPEEYLIEKSIDWIIKTEIQKKDLNGKYITIKHISSENKKDDTEGIYNDSDMKEGNEYRIIKTVISAGSLKRRIFSDMANAIAKNSKNNKSETEFQQKSEKNKEESLNKLGNKKQNNGKNIKTLKESENAKTHIINGTKLPKTGSPFGGGILVSIGAALSGLGITLIKKNKKK